MISLPSSSSSLLVRTDFTSDEAWARTRAAAEAESPEGFSAGLEIVDDRTLDGAPAAALREAALAAADPEQYAVVLFVADQQALSGAEHPILVIDLDPDGRAPFRCVARELWSVENNLNLANMGWEDFAGATDPDGTFRGFA